MQTPDTPLSDEAIRAEVAQCDQPGCFLCRVSRELLETRQMLKQIVDAAPARHAPLHDSVAQLIRASTLGELLHQRAAIEMELANRVTDPPAE